LETILITGASSFTAPYIARKLKDSHTNIIATSLSGKSDANSFDQVVQCDITDIESVEKTIDSTKPDRVIHLAGLSFVGHKNPSDFYNVNVIGTDNLLSILEKCSHKLQSILISSSANIYGAPEITEITESVTPNPVNHYANSKLAMENIARTYSSVLPIIITRPFNYIGYGQNISFVIPKIIDAYARNNKSIELGNINVSRDFSSVYDTVDAYAKLLVCKKAIGETFNVCSGRATSLASILSDLEEICGRKIDININQNFIRKNEILSLTGSNKKLLKTIDWQPTTSLKPILKEMYGEYLSKYSK